MTNTTNQEGVDMGYIHAVFKSLADTIVTASELPKQMEAIKADMSGLTADLERTKARNIELDTLLADTRRQRDEAEQSLSQVRAAYDNVTREHDRVVLDLKHASDEHARMERELAAMRSERDDYGLRHMEAEDRANQAEAKLKKLREALGMAEESVKPVDPKPWAAPEPMPEPTPTPPPIQQVGEQVMAEPEKVYEDDPHYWGITKPEHREENSGKWFKYR